MAQYEVYDRDKHGRDTPQSTFGPVVKVEKHEDGKIHVITLNRPHRLNAIGDGLSEALYDALLAYRDDPAGRVAIVTGAGRAFCAGADLINTAETRAGEASGTRPRRPAGRTPDRYTSPLSESMRLWKPVIGRSTASPSRGDSTLRCSAISASWPRTPALALRKRAGTWEAQAGWPRSPGRSAWPRRWN